LKFIEKLNCRNIFFFFAAPPSYEECCSGAVAIEDDDEQHPIDKNSYAPRYPVYSFAGLPTS
jgi:hypothetical protein